MTDPEFEQTNEDRLIALARNGQADIERALTDLLNGSDNLRELGEWVQGEWELAREALDAGDSEGSIGRIASLAENFLRWDLPEMTALLCGIAANYRSQLDEVAPVDEANWQNVIGLLALHLGRLDPAEEFFTSARSFASRAQEPDMEAAALLNLCNVARSRGDASLALERALEALRLAEAVGDTRGSAQLQLTLVHMAIENGDMALARGQLEDLANLPKLRQPDLTASYHHAWGRVLAAERRWDEAERAMQASLRAARRAHHSDHEVATMQSLAALAADVGNDRLARRRIRAALEAARKRRLPHRLLSLLPAYISMQLRAGNTAGAVEAARELVERSIALDGDLVNAHSLLGAALLDSGDAQGALGELQLARAATTGEDIAASTLTAPRERTLDPESAAAIFHNAVLAYSQLGTTLEHLDELEEAARGLADPASALEHLGLTLGHGGHLADAERLLSESIDRRPAAEQAWSSVVAAGQFDDPESTSLRAALIGKALAAATAQDQRTLAMRSRNDLALVRVEEGDLEGGLELLQANLRLAEEVGDQIMREQTHYNLAETRRRLGDLVGAEADARASLALAQALEDAERSAAALDQLGIMLSQQEKLEEARTCYERARELAGPEDPSFASALSGLAGLAMADGDPATAVDLYMDSLRLDTRSPVQRLENLIYLGQALAATGQRRRYRKVLQQVVDACATAPFELHLATSIAKIADYWSSAGKPTFAGEALAVDLLVWAVRASEEGGFLADEVTPFDAALSATGHELVREQVAGEPVERTEAALKKELLRHLPSEEAVGTLLNLLEAAKDGFR